MRSFITSVLYFPTVFLVAIIWRFRFVRHTLSSSIRSNAPTPVRTSASQTYPPTPPIPNTATRAFFSRSIASFPSSNSVLENCVNIYELLLSHFSYRNTLYYVRFQTASLSSYLCQAIAKCSPAHAAAYTVGRAIIQNYEFIGIHFCLFRWFAVRPTFNNFCGLSVCRGHRLSEFVSGLEGGFE